LDLASQIFKELGLTVDQVSSERGRRRELMVAQRGREDIAEQMHRARVASAPTGAWRGPCPSK